MRCVFHNRNVRKQVFIWWGVKQHLDSHYNQWNRVHQMHQWRLLHLYFGCIVYILVYMSLTVLNQITPLYKQHMWKKQQPKWLMCSREESEKLPCVIEQLWCLPLQRQISFHSLNVITGCQWAEEKPLPLSLTHTRCLLLFQLQMSSRQHSCRG